MAWLVKYFHIHGHPNKHATGFIPLLWSCFIGLLSILPARLINRGEFGGNVHTATHVLAFCITMAVFSACAKTLKGNIAYTLWALSLSVVSEWLETVVFHSRFEWGDVMLDFFGVALGLLFVAISVTQHRVFRYQKDGPP